MKDEHAIEPNAENNHEAHAHPVRGQPTLSGGLDWEIPW